MKASLDFNFSSVNRMYFSAEYLTPVLTLRAISTITSRSNSYLYFAISFILKNF